jgi:hypothetical protein
LFVIHKFRKQVLGIQVVFEGERRV